MPIYEYRCGKGHTFEVMQRMTDDPVATCQTCSAPVQRVFHPVAVHFKGKGFYNTDYGTRKRAKETAEAGEGGSSAKTSDTKSETKSETKPAGKSDAKTSSSASKASKSE